MREERYRRRRGKSVRSVGSGIRTGENGKGREHEEMEEWSVRSNGNGIRTKENANGGE